ncbi:TIGR03915 family putative DNA repair protein [Cellvibrio mixtus]|uniref:TIGR03915 family putative DNA repair protein n=1 Tax=Cellvibrio mixtus TaxID=39650 RepID=UPI000586F346|nr:TIGR03915 family putative DNA repair protein [Cellvibrio mixtus]
MVFVYDGSYEGLLSCIFTIFKDRITPIAINAEANHQFTLLDVATRITTNDEWAVRVLKGVDERTHSCASGLMYKIFLSELPLCEMLVYQLVLAIIQKGDGTVLENFANPHILKAAQIEKMIHREVHRMHAFVRFQKSRNGFFYAAIDPDFNVLPLIGEHFEKRYADQSWLIFDTRRHYGLYYDQDVMKFACADDPVFSINLLLLQDESFQDEKEKQYQALWENYFHAVNIRERNNTKLHLRHMPRRYWKYLTEKQGTYKR